MEEILKSLLAKRSYVIKTSLNGEEGISEILKKENLANSITCKFDLIFLDLQMPVLDGFQVINIF